MMTRTVNAVFARMDERMEALEAHPQGHPNRSAYLEMVVKELPLFMKMTADLAVLADDLSSQQKPSAPTEGESHHSGQYL